MKTKLHYFFFILFISTSFSQNIQLSDATEISVFTCGRGEELYSTFGHTAIRIKDPSNQLDLVYNYGAFDFRVDNFYMKFLKGDLQYFMNVNSYEEFIYEYQYDKREVTEQILDFSLIQKQTLFDKLTSDYASDKKYYTYKFINRNCTTMVVEKINETIGNPLIQKTDDKTISYRTVLYPYFENYFWYKFGINIVFGAKTDAKAEKLFLPIELLNSLDKAKINDKPFVNKKIKIVNGNEIQSTFSFFNSIYLILVVLLAMILVNKNVVFKVYLFFVGLVGLFLCLVGLYSQHQEVLWNYNAILFNPLYLLAPFLNRKWLNRTMLTCGALLLIYIVVLITKPFIFLMLPFILTNGFIIYKLYKKSLLSDKSK